MEHVCKYISIRALKRLCTFKSDVYLSDTQNGKEYLSEMIKGNKMIDGMSIFVCSDLLEFFVTTIVDKIKNTFVLVTGMSIKTCPVEALTQPNFFKLINNKYLIKWCSQNNSIFDHPKIIQVPLGIDYHSVYNSPEKWKKIADGNTPLEQEKYLNNVITMAHSIPFYERINKIYVNFDVNADRFGQRKQCLKDIPKSLMVMYQQKLKRTQTWINTTKYAFVVSPYGQGMDCHRTWEALILGSIPIIKSREFVKLFEDLPVLFVNDWKDINQQLLDDTMERFKNMTFNYDKLTMAYWNKIVFDN
jgi:hypothetical protein